MSNSWALWEICICSAEWLYWEPAAPPAQPCHEPQIIHTSAMFRLSKAQHKTLALLISGHDNFKVSGLNFRFILGKTVMRTPWSDLFEFFCLLNHLRYQNMNGTMLKQIVRVMFLAHHRSWKLPKKLSKIATSWFSHKLLHRLRPSTGVVRLVTVC